MKYILDSCIALKWVLPEGDSDVALRLRDAFRSAAYELLAPEIFPVEIAHALTRAERQGRIPISSSGRRLADALTNCPLLFPSSPLLARAVELSSQARIGVYDCLYVALAEREGCALVTADDRLVRTFPGGSVIPLSAL
ncbi:MAG: type II toxin-antitoxin system VapC family toxin [Planctomycetota bacterium]|nr:type II toxin-antitoxin system VapC family toxin [Planctomycetaceae bacterium]MDQ3332907.1 type II toxin-antitoxin system VapC family toxin [Planctomycetota bacterium]